MVVGYIAEHGWAPTYSEIMDATGMTSKATVNSHLLKLQQEGKLRLGKERRAAGARMIALNPADPRKVVAAATQRTLRHERGAPNA